MTDQKKEKYIITGIIIGFASVFVFSNLAQIIFPSDFSGEFPVYPADSIVIIEMGLAGFLIGSALMGLKLEDEKQILPAAGFTVLAISTGIMMSSLFEVTQNTTVASWEKFYYIAVSAHFLYFPAMLMISTYTDFKKWVRYIGLISCMPLLVSTLLFLFHFRDYLVLEIITNTGYFLMGLAEFIWAINVYSNHRNKTKLSSK